MSGNDQHIKKRLAVVLFNLGGPDSLKAVQPFLFNLFNDPVILRIPAPMRQMLAYGVSRSRARTARRIYGQLGGGSPILSETSAQARALEAVLARETGDDVKVVIAMRYWHPRAAAAMEALSQWQPDEIVLLPLYPHYSSVTTGSSLAEWRRLARRAGLTVPTSAVCCYAQDAGFVAAHAALIAPHLEDVSRIRVLFSAHGLPKRIADSGDPYRRQVEDSCAVIAAALNRPKLDWPKLDWVVCYQSRVGPMQWIGPSTADEIRRAGRDGCGVVVVPVAFVSEHSETLVELDMELRGLADSCGVPVYRRVPTLGASELFIAALADLVSRARRGEGRICPAGFGRMEAA